MNNISNFINQIVSFFKFWIIIQPWESGLRVRAGKNVKTLNGGMHFIIPYLDSVYVQSIRKRITSFPIQTLTTKDDKNITLSGAIGYSVSDIKQLYNTLHQPESTLVNMVMSEIAECVYTNSLVDITPQIIEQKVLNKLEKEHFGITFEYFKITNFAVVRTYRIMDGSSNVYDGMSMSKRNGRNSND
jgi:hypothetical protein